MGNDDDRPCLLKLASEVLLLDQLKPRILVTTSAMNRCWRQAADSTMWSSSFHYFNALTFIFSDRDLLSEVAGSPGPVRSAVVSLTPRRAVLPDIGQMAEINLKPGILVAGEGEMRALHHA